ncbi:MAG: hypothetical protein QOE62_694 [Actinomycetota bacterium]|nr:hypothetical protein [Actinomycetota bacterium]
MDTRSGRDSIASANVTGNARITGALGAVIFVLLFFEGLTIPSVQSLMWLHAFLGMLLVAFVVAKIASTSYRFARYYLGQRDYVTKGPPPAFLRLLGPVATVTTIAVLATGIGALLARHTHWLQFAHKASFVVWFAAMTLHVLGHALETPALAFADWRRGRRREAPGAPARFAVLMLAVAAGLVLAVLSLHWAHQWQHDRGAPANDRPATAVAS